MNGNTSLKSEVENLRKRVLAFAILDGLGKPFNRLVDKQIAGYLVLIIMCTSIMMSMSIQANKLSISIFLAIILTSVTTASALYSVILLFRKAAGWLDDALSDPICAAQVNSEIVKWLKNIGSYWTQIIIAVISVIVAIVLANVSHVFFNQEFLNNNASYFAVAIIGFSLGQGAYWSNRVLNILRIIKEIDNKLLCLYKIDPSKSEFLISLARTYRLYMVTSALLITLSVGILIFAGVDLNSKSTWIPVSLSVIGYIGTLRVFIVSQLAFSSIIRNEKRKSINIVQSEINKLIAEYTLFDLAKSDMLKSHCAVLKMINKAPNSMLNLKSTWTLFGTLITQSVLFIMKPETLKFLYNSVVSSGR